MLQHVINIELGEIRYEIMKWIYLAQKRPVVIRAMVFVFSKWRNFLE
jgi:hypothetical protein